MAYRKNKSRFSVNMFSAALLTSLALSGCGGGGGGGVGAGVSPPVTTLPTGSLDFTTRCAQPGVIRCVGFDSASDIAGTYGNNSRILPPSFSGAIPPALDTSVKASGASALKFTIPSNSPADTSGSYFTNFSSDLQTQFGANSEFYIQWRQRFSPEFLNTMYQGGSGWKQD